VYSGWEKIEPALGQGGQGTVYRARSPERCAERQDSIRRIIHELRQLSGVGPQDSAKIEELLKGIVDVGGPEEFGHLGALKVFKIPDGDNQERKNALGRLTTEIEALKGLDDPGILKLLAWNYEETCIVTEYHPHGSLEASLDKYRGNALESLVAFRPLVKAVCTIHHKNAIHRDIKLKNIFVATDGRLVLGDLGIVIFRDAPGGRFTETYERVGTRGWMAPWANTEHRLALAEVNPTLDLFPLGKVLWCMVSGRTGLDFWYYDRPAKDNRPATNLELLFPGDPAMKEVNAILAKCVVEEEENCLKSANELLTLVDKAVERIRGLGQKPENDDRWLCLVCKKGYYGKESWRWRMELATKPQNNNYHPEASVFFCDHCGHMQVFRTAGTYITP
jgi:serine/threonine protein kinase